MATLKKRAFQGAAWSFMGYGGSQVLRLGSNLILTRLLFPELFGLMALINTMITGLRLFSDIGIGPNIIQSKRGDDQTFLNTAWTVQVIRGTGIWLVSLIAAWPLSHFYNQPELRWLIPIVAFTTVIEGFGSTAQFSLQRNLSFGKLEIFDLVVQFIASLVMIGWALVNPTIWALVVGTIISSTFKAIRSYWLIPGTTHRLMWEQQAVQELITFGRWIFISTIMFFLASQSDRLILGKLLPLSLLGMYSIALMLADVPRLILGRISNRVLFPILSKRVDLPRKTLREKILKLRRFMLLGIAALIIMIAVSGDFIINVLYDDRYKQAEWMLPILALGIWPNILAATISPTLLAMGKPFYAATGNFLKVAYMIICIPLAFSLFGVLGAVVVVAFNDLPFYLSVLYGCWREKLLFLAQDFKATVFMVASLMIVLAIRYQLGFGWPLQTIIQ